MTKRLTKTEKLLKAIDRKGGMTRKEMVSFLLGLSGQEYEANYDRGTYNALLYGTSDRAGILERFCDKDTTERFPVYTLRNTSGPFTQSRAW